MRTGVGYSVLPDYLCHDDIRSGRLVQLGPEGRKIIFIWPGAKRVGTSRVNYARDIMMAFPTLIATHFIANKCIGSFCFALH